MGFPRQEYWSGLTVPSPGDLFDSRIEPLSPALAGGSCITLSHSGSPWIWPRSVQFSHSVVSNSLQPNGLQHARPPCPSPTPRDYSNSCPLSQRYHPTISSSVIPFSTHLQSFPASGSFQMSQLFASGGQSIGLSALASVLPMNIQDWSILCCSAFLIVQLSHPYMTTGKTIALTRQNFVDKVMSLLFNMLSRLVITFLPRSKHLLISWLQSPSAVILETPKIKSATESTVGFIYLPWSDGTRCLDPSFLNVEL